MKQFWMIAGLIASIILAGCGQSNSDLYERDWCYLFDFTQGQQGFLISSGTWVPQGIASDSTGLLQTSYGYNRDVYPNIVQVTVVRPSGITGEIQATAAGTAFGVSTYFTATMPADLNIAQLAFTPSTDGVEYIGDRNAINITVDGSQPIAIESIFVGGMGASPFPHNLCDDSTPTPVITDSGTGTPFTTTPQPTPTGTWSSPTPDSPGPSNTLIVNFDEDSHPYTVVDGTIEGGGYTGNSLRSRYEEVSGGSNMFAIVEFDLPAAPEAVSMKIQSGGVSTGPYHVELCYQYLEAPESCTATGELFWYEDWHDWFFEFSGDPDDVTGLRVSVYTGFGNSPGPDGRWARLDDIEIILPDGVATPTPGPTNTPLPSPTMGPTNTPEPLWSQCVDFTASNYQFTAIGADYEDERGFIQEDPDAWSVGRSGLDQIAKKKIKLRFGAGQIFSGQIRLTDYASHATSWLTVSGNEIFLDYSASSWLPTSTFWIAFDGGFDGLILERVCWLDPNPSTGTPIPGTGTAVGSRTPLPTVTGTIPPSRTPVLVPNPPVIIITATNGAWITSTPIYGGTGVYNPTGTTSPLITGTPGTEGTPGGDGSGGTGYGSGGGGFGDIGDMIGFGWNIGWGLFGALIAYLGQATNIVTGLLTAFTNATPQPIPGLPMCITNPMAHDLCALWYIMDNTFFAPATPGQYIVPLLQILFNVVIAIYFVRWVLKIIWRGEAVTHVE